MVRVYGAILFQPEQAVQEQLALIAYISRYDQSRPSMRNQFAEHREETSIANPPIGKCPDTPVNAGWNLIQFGLPRRFNSDRSDLPRYALLGGLSR